MHVPDKVFTWPVRVYYEDTDCGGIVYYANYLKFMERARSEWLRTLGFEQDRLQREEGIVFGVSRIQVEYLKPACFNDLLTVCTRLTTLGKASLIFAQEIARDAAGELLCRGETRIACVAAASLRPCAIPSQVMAKIHSETA
jgi:acyl-CoA thioester hydrolase